MRTKTYVQSRVEDGIWFWLKLGITIFAFSKVCQSIDVYGYHFVEREWCDVPLNILAILVVVFLTGVVKTDLLKQHQEWSPAEFSFLGIDVFILVDPEVIHSGNTSKYRAMLPHLFFWIPFRIPESMVRLIDTGSLDAIAYNHTAGVLWRNRLERKKGEE